MQIEVVALFANPMDAHPKEKPTPLLGCASALALVAIGFAIYFPILPGAFLMDDERLVKLDNPIASGKLDPLSIWFQADFPLSNLVFWWQWLAWGMNPTGYHVVNILLHTTGALLLWRVLVRLKIRGSWLAAALFLAHPVGVASVARIAELKNTLSLPFLLCSLWAYLRYDESLAASPEKTQVSYQRTAWCWYGISLVAFVLAFLSKSTTLILPALLLACAAWRRKRIGLRDLLHTAPHFVLATGYGLMAVWFQKHQALAGQTLEAHSFIERLLSAGKASWFYLAKSLLPLNLNLVYPVSNVSSATARHYAPLLLITSLILISFAFRKTWGRCTLFALACFLVMLFPALGFFDAQFMTKWLVSDHLQYLALMAPVALTAAALASLPYAVLRRGLSVLLLAACAMLACQRAKVFSNEERLLSDTISKNPRAWAAYNDLGCLHAQKKDYSSACSHFCAALEANPSFADAHLNLAQTLLLQGDARNAEKHSAAAVQIQPQNPRAHKGLGRALAAQKHPREALGHFHKALALDPAPETRLELAATLYSAGEHRRAIYHLRRVLRSNPDSVEALNNLAWLLSTCSDSSVRNGHKALCCAKRACRLTRSNDPMVLGTLAASYAEAGDFGNAVAASELGGKLAKAAGDHEGAALHEQFAARYKAGKSWHESPPAEEM